MTSRSEKKYLENIPGTTVFTLEKAREGRHLTAFCMALLSEDNRLKFKSSEHEFLAQFSLTDEQQEAVIKRDYNVMLAQGGNIYCLSKIAAADGESFQQLASRMTGIPLGEFQGLMQKGGRQGVDDR